MKDVICLANIVFIINNHKQKRVIVKCSSLLVILICNEILLSLKLILLAVNSVGTNQNVLE
jgi:hypothetical protein